MESAHKRQSNIELLRIVAILMVIILHYLNGSMGGELQHVVPGSLNYYLSHFIESLCIIAVNVFVLITGYFSYKKTQVKVSKVVNLFLVMIFWGLLLSVVTVFWLLPQTINFSLVKGIVEASLSQWFVVIYSILYLLIPFINKMINAIDEKSLRVILIINLIFFYVWPTLFTNIPDSSKGYGIVNFINLYLIGAYIHKYHDEKVKLNKLVALYLILTVITTVFSFVAGRAYDYNSVFTLFSSVIFFEIFKSLNIGYNKTINRLAIYTFSVYLIDVNGYFNKFLYRNLFRSNEYWNDKLMIVNLLLAVIGIYIICILLDYLRTLIFGKAFNYLSNKVKLKIGK